MMERDEKIGVILMLGAVMASVFVSMYVLHNMIYGLFVTGTIPKRYPSELTIGLLSSVAIFIAGADMFFKDPPKSKDKNPYTKRTS